MSPLSVSIANATVSGRKRSSHLAWIPGNVLALALAAAIAMGWL